jgi:uncharacterized protein (DUF362 family)
MIIKNKKNRLMKRRDFLKKSAGAGLAAGAAFSLGGYDKVWPAEMASAEYDMVAIMGGSPEAMFDLGIQEFGGMGTFIQKGQKVLVKPNIGWDVVPDYAACTNPALVTRVIEHVFRAGAKEVYVFDNSVDHGPSCYRTSGIERAAKAAGAKVVPAHSERYYQEVNIPGALVLKKVKVHEVLLDTDVFVNVPILKDHDTTRMTGCLKNMMGVIWDRRWWHSNNLDQCIADYGLFEKKPVIHILDCYNVMFRNGPRGVSRQDIVQMKSQIIARDWVAADTAATKLLGVELEKIEHIPLAAKMGLGTTNIESLNIKRIQM